MSGVPRFTAEENLRRIQMETSTRFLLVEGEDDIPIYEASLEQISNQEGDFVIVHGGGKGLIEPFVNDCSNRNFICLLDKDFDNPLDFTDERIFVLKKYSIENYFINKNVALPLTALATKARKRDLEHALNIEPWLDHLDNSLKDLLCLFHLYQADSSTDREKWSDVYIYDNGCRSNVSATQVTRVIRQLFPSGPPRVPQNIIDMYTERFCVSNFFPGKLLIQGFYYFIGNFSDSICRSFKRLYPHVEAFRMAMVQNLRHSREFNDDMKPIIDFLYT